MPCGIRRIVSSVQRAKAIRVQGQGPCISMGHTLHRFNLEVTGCSRPRGEAGGWYCALVRSR